MKTELTIQARCFPVTIQNQRTGEKQEDTVVLDKQQLQAAQLVGQSSNELIYRIYNREGFQVLEIGKATKREITLNLEELYRLHSVAMVGKRGKADA